MARVWCLSALLLLGLCVSSQGMRSSSTGIKALKQGRCLAEVIDEPPENQCQSLIAAVKGVGESVKYAAVAMFGHRVHPTDPACTEETSVKKAVGDVFQDVRCCSTAKAKVAQIEEKIMYCDNRNTCWKTLEHVLPKALAYYKKQEDALCVTTTTTTTTTASKVTTTASKANNSDTKGHANASDTKGSGDDKAPSKAEGKHEAANATNASKGTANEAAKDNTAWCVDKCLAENATQAACDNLCKKVEKKIKKVVKKKVDKMKAKLDAGKGKNGTAGNKSCD